MTEFRGEKINDAITRIVAEFFQRESNGTSIITVTRVDVTHDLKKASVYITVMPTEMEEGALDFAKRNRPNIKEAIKNKLKVFRIPFVEVEIDKGEKLRQRIEEISQQDTLGK